MEYTLEEKKAIVLALKALIDADNNRHPSEANLFNTLFKYLVKPSEAASVMAYAIDATIMPEIAFNQHVEVLREMMLWKKKEFISMLTILAIIDNDVDIRETEAICYYRKICEISEQSFSSADAIIHSKTFLPK